MAQPSQSKILVVQSEAVTREILLQLLRMAGFDALSATTGEQALVLLRKHRNDIGWLLTELEMPGLVCGAVLADEFHSFHPSRPVVFTSAHAGESPTETAQAVVLPQPVSPLRVLETLQALRCASGIGSNTEQAAMRRAA
jgi:CheY-like chemotaxis protein